MSTSLSAYEQERLKNIAANKAALVALGIEQDVASIRTLKTQKTVPKLAKKPIEKSGIVWYC